MPKIVIREIDNTTAVGAAYANFAVVVPGFVKDNDPEFTPNMDVFDDNGIYECNDKTAFEKNIGLTSSKEHKVVGAAEPTRAEDWDEPRSLTRTEFDEEIVIGKLYVATPNAAQTIGLCKDEEWLYELANSEKTYVFKEPATGGAAAASADDEAGYTKFIRLDSEGHDEIYQAHYGNQIAYELLSMGYTVLYKKIESTEYLSQASFWNPLKDKTLYDFRYLLSGLANGNAAVYQNMVNVAEFNPEDEKGSPFDTVEITNRGRGDCIALLDIDESTYLGKTQEQAITAVRDFAKANVTKSKYAAAFAPSVRYDSGCLSQPGEFGDNDWFPASFHYLACAANSAERFNEWYANAGYTRGISNRYTIKSVGCKFGEAAVQMLQRRAAYVENNVTLLDLAVNPIINLRGSHYVWGNRTTFPLGNANDPINGDLKASHFLNIRQLCSSIKKDVYMACRRITFDPNSDMLWINFCNLIKPLLETMKADQGIADYKIMKVKNKRKAFLSVIIRIVPIEAVEDFDISIHLEDSFDGVVATTEE